MRGEVDDLDTPTPTLGAAEGVDDDEHGAHTFLYVPDLTERSGYSTHRVPERQAERAERRPLGFRR